MPEAAPSIPMQFPIRTPFKHKKPETVWPLLTSGGFTRVSGSADARSEKWSLSVEGGRFVVRIDKQGHKTEHQRTGRKAHGGRGHYHKEWYPTGKPGKALYSDDGKFQWASCVDDPEPMNDRIAKAVHIPR